MSDVRDSPLAEHLPLGSVESGQVATEAAQELESAGSLLRQAREAAGLHIDTLAASLKVPAKKLEALEAGRFDLLPDAVFVRALASSVCRNLKIDTAPVLERLPQTNSPTLGFQGRGINTPFRAPGDRFGRPIWAQVSRPAVLAGALLLLGALVLILLPAMKTGFGVSHPDAAPKTLNLQPSIPAVIEADPQAVKAGTSAPRAPVSTVVLSSSDASSPISVFGPPPVTTPLSPFPASAAVQVLAAPASAASAVPSGMSTGIVVFRAKGASWVEVTDSKGVIVLRRTLSAGEVVGASGALPLAAVVGRADATQVYIRGNAFDLNAATKDNVARFEVK